MGERDWVNSDTWLWIQGLNFKLNEKWTWGGEYRVLRNETFEDDKTGVLFQISRNLSDTIDLTTGYNFTDYDDDLTNRDEYDRTGFFIRMNGRI